MNPALLAVGALVVWAFTRRPAGARARARTRPAPNIPPPVVWPVHAGKWPTSKRHQFGADRGGHIHQGVDIYAPAGSEVVAPFAGVVGHVNRKWASGFSGYGKAVIVRSELPDGRRIWIMFSHLGKIAVRAGDQVAAGELLGTVGTTKYTRADKTGHFESSDPHVHVEVTANPWRHTAVRLDPAAYLKH